MGTWTEKDRDEDGRGIAGNLVDSHGHTTRVMCLSTHEQNYSAIVVLQALFVSIVGL